MNKRALERRMADARMPGPVFRDVAPDREVMALYSSDEKPSIVSDMPSAMMAACRRVAKAQKVSVARLLIGILRTAADKRAGGF